MKTPLMFTLALLVITSIDVSLADIPPRISENPIRDIAEIIKKYNVDQLDDCSIMKIEADFDENGKNDYMLSTRCYVGGGDSYIIGTWGNAGGNWTVYLNIDDKYVLYPVTFFHPLSFEYQSAGKEGVFNLLSYHRHSAEEGSYGIVQYDAPFTSLYDDDNNGKLIFSETVYREAGYQVSQKHWHLLEGSKTAESFKCKLRAYFAEECVWE